MFFAYVFYAKVINHQGEILWGTICVDIALLCLCIGNIIWGPVVQLVDNFTGAQIGEIPKHPCGSPNRLNNFLREAKVYTGK